ncbi:hypothetical protein WCLP8_4180001 [uncultured Gammaproteobacteria bacterium]
MNRDICATNALQSLARREIVSIALMNHDFPASSSLYPSAYGALPWTHFIINYARRRMMLP